MTRGGLDDPDMMRPSVPRRGAPRQAPADLAARILLLRDDLMVLDKPAGLPVHRGPRGGASLEDWLEPLRMGRRHAPQPAHRLDADTAGCLALGRTKPALAALGRIFAAGLAGKTYWAVVAGGPAADAGRIALPLLKVSSVAQGWRMVPDAAGQAAATGWRVLGRGDGLAWLELRPETGRTHQLRVHCAAAGWPILGDPLYGAGGAGGLHLLARRLVLPLDPTAEAVAPVPPHMRDAIRRCGGAG